MKKVYHFLLSLLLIHEILWIQQGCVNKAYVALAAARVLEESFSGFHAPASTSFSDDPLSPYDFRAALRTRRPGLSPQPPVINNSPHFFKSPPPRPPLPPQAPPPPPPPC